MSLFLKKNSVIIPAIAFSIVLTLGACSPIELSHGPAEELTQEGDDLPVPPLSQQEVAKLARFSEPALSQSHTATILSNYGHLDPNQEVPTTLLEKALLYFDQNQSHIDNKKYLTIVDFQQHSSNSRLYIISMETGVVTRLHVAHGKGSDQNDDGVADKFSNVPNSQASSLGFYLTAETYSGKHGLSLRLDGLSATNSNVRSRAVVIHGASYVYDSDKKAGRSWGCLAVPMNDRDNVVTILKGGSLIYAGQSQN